MPIQVTFLDDVKTIEFILSQLYFSEFVVMDRLNQHPEGINFYEWLWRHKLISKDERNRINKQIEIEYSDLN